MLCIYGTLYGTIGLDREVNERIMEQNSCLLPFSNRGSREFSPNHALQITAVDRPGNPRKAQLVLCLLLDNLPVAYALCQVLQQHLCDVRRQDSVRPALLWRRLPSLLQA